MLRGRGNSPCRVALCLRGRAPKAKESVAKILVVDDEPDIIELAALYLERDGHSVLRASDGQEGVEQFRFHRPDLVVADIMMPRMDGYDLLRALRAEGPVPVILLTARGEETERIVGLEMGADDYLGKPFNPRELAARVEAVLRRTDTRREPATLLECGNVRLDVDRREVAVDGTEISLRPKEFELLSCLIQNAGLAMSRAQLLETVWGYLYVGGTRTVDVHVNQLRSKLRGADACIATVWGVGYKLVPPDAVAD